MTNNSAPLPWVLSERLASVDYRPGAASVGVDGIELSARTERELRQILANHIYRHWHTGIGDRRRGGTPGRNPEYEKRLIASIPHATTSLVSPVVETDFGGFGSDGILVAIDGVRVRIGSRSVVWSDEDQGLARVKVPAVRPVLSPGYLLIYGSDGGLQGATPGSRIYFSIASFDDAVAVWRAVVAVLESSALPYRAKVASADRLYPRTDALVVYLGSAPVFGSGDPAVALRQRLIEQSANLPLWERTSVFGKRLAAGVATASQARDRRPYISRMSFGEHRAFAVATGVLDGRSSSPIDHRVQAAMAEANINPGVPAENIEDYQEGSA
ncbi:T3SS effector HopA1 family protein [Nocardia mexicana]|uniref:Uncharacterized protein n=1 Tax=Nocardia mexicana TaxID=279262 RepID=A0A370GIJ0_9NOCA|nr:T3SS effector HopA1 family protein [Nocardia mexicana]RDI43467.1 hypothetical protein DFR68_12124 [Nocardia mexicana]